MSAHSSSPSPDPDTPLRMLARDRLVAAVLAPVLALIAFGSYVVDEKLDTYRHRADLLAAAQLARTTHDLARELEQERGLSALYVSTGRAGGASRLEGQRLLTDGRRDAFRREVMLPRMQLLLGDDRPDPALGELETLREEVDDDADVKTVLAGYGGLVATVTTVSYRLSADQSAGLITAYADLGSVKDRLLRERSLGLAWLRQGSGGHDLLPLLIGATAEARAFAESFRAHASPAERRLYDQVVRGPVLQQVEQLRAKVLAGRLTAADSAAWDSSHSRLAVLVDQAEDALAAATEHDIRHDLDAARTAFYAILATVLALVVFAVETLRRSERRAVLAEESARKLFRAVEQSPVSVMITDVDGQIEYVNPAFAAMTGYGRGEVIGHNPRRLRSEDTGREVYSRLWSTIRSGRDWRGEIRNRRKDGSLYWEQMTVAPVRGPGGEVVNYIALKEDVTEVKGLRLSLEREHANVRRILEAIHDGIALIGPDRAFQYVNPALLVEFGPVDGRDCDRYFGATRAACAFGLPLQKTLRREWRSPTSQRTYEMTATPVNNPDGSISTLEVFHDITARKQAEDALDAAREAAEIANRAKSEFLAAMSHELRTPLNAVIGFSEIMAEQLLGPLGVAQYATYAADINQSGRHLLQLINDILDVARIEAGKVTLHEEDMDVATALAAGLAMVHDRAERDALHLASDTPADLPLLWADPRRIKQVLVNLLGNAVKFTPAGGTITVAARLLEGGDLEVSVADTGIGIAAEDVAKVMAPFGQADSGLARRYGGSGLGLPLSRKFMELHGGRLSLESLLGRGTTIRLTFPKARLHPRPS